MKLDCEHEQIKQLQSDCAAYREALEKIASGDVACFHSNPSNNCKRVAKQALSLTSGKELLEKIKQYEKDLSSFEGMSEEWEQCRTDNTKLKALVGEAEEGLRRTILWAESASMKMVRIEGESINWNYLNDGRNALTAITNYRKNL